MNLDERYQNVGVIGAAGKMGSGISLLLCQQMALRKLGSTPPGKRFKLTLMDVNDEALDGLHSYLAAQLLRGAEKITGALRDLYADRKDLVENGEIINAFVQDAMSQIRLTTDLGALKGCSLVMEAIAENIDLKIKIYQQLNEICGPEAWYFTNTSSIPIGLLDREVGLGGRIIGYHFYNPPAIQRLLELITAPDTAPELVAASKTIAADLRKIVIPANDIAGFIGNGHFIRDGLYGLAEMQRLCDENGFAEAVYMVNKVSNDFLVRPMGIFQLIDYVGVDVFQCILRVMNQFIDGEELHSDLIDTLIEKGVRGGQNSDGSQKDGFFKYAKGRPAAVYNIKTGEYVDLAAAFTDPLDTKLGPLPSDHYAWKDLSRDKGKGAKLTAYFKNLNADDTMGALLGAAYLKNSKVIGEGLIKSGVAANADDVNGVLMNGFFHLYGPVNDYV